jgi:hypothetical protein
MRRLTRQRAPMVRNVFRQLERLETRAAAATKKWSYSARILVVDPEKGCTGVVVLETGKPTTRVPTTPEDIEWVRADLEKHRAGRK